MAPEFTEIGLGKPLGVEILAIYSGDVPGTGGFLQGKKKDVMLVSGTKSSVTFESAARAINKIQKGVRDKEKLSFSALEEGSPIVYYTPAVDTTTTLISFELVADNFRMRHSNGYLSYLVLHQGFLYLRQALLF